MTTEEFINKAKEVHKDKYSYEHTEYVNSTTNVVVTCPVHGDFSQNPNSHLRGCGCRQCSYEARRTEKHKLTKEEFIQRATEIHGGKYDYSKVEFIDKLSQVCVICPIHGEFTISPRQHLHGKGCVKCANPVYNKNHKCDREQFIEKSKALYGDKFDYSKVVYRNSFEYVTLICPVHGEFNITPGNHLKIVGGCPQCSKEKRRHRQPMSNDKYIEKVRECHGDKYDLSKTVYISMHDDVTAACPIHGEFKINAYSFTHNHGCPTCGAFLRAQRGAKTRKKPAPKTKITKEVFEERARAKHGDKYDYSLVDVTKRKVTIICPVHGKFEQNMQSHMRGVGCSKCAKEEQSKRQTMTTEQFIEKARAKHGDKYDYSKVVYTGCYGEVIIGCPIHGDFRQKAYVHLHNGCSQCMAMTNSEKLLRTTKSFIEAARSVHGNTFDYSQVKYVDSHTEVAIICPHGHLFYQKPYKHLYGRGCPSCANNISKAEQEIVNFLRSELNEEVNTNNRLLLPSGREIDIYVPNKKIAIEFDGLYWHSEEKKPDKKYHLKKTEECQENSIRLIHIFEDEWNDKQEIVKSRLSQILGHTANRIYARMCEVRTVDSKECANFLDENHIQGASASLVRLGLYHQDELVAVMTFCTPRVNLNSRKKIDDEYELIRFCPKRDTTVVGGASKLFKRFVRDYNPREVVSYADRRWSVGKVYESLGFTLDHISEPGYFYVVGDERHGRFAYRKDVLVAQGYDRNKSEHEIMLERGIFRIYDCGCLCYKWYNDTKTEQ